MLVEKGADVNATANWDARRCSSRRPATSCTATVKLLLDKGADPNAKDKDGNSALTAAAWVNNLDVVKLLVAKGAAADVPDGEGFTPLANAASNCNLEAVKFFLSKGANVNTANTKGGQVKFGQIQLIKLTPLMLASTFCAPEVVKTLLDAGAKVNDADIRGMTPIQFAVSSEAQNPAVVKLLLKAGADVNAKIFRRRDGSRLGQEVRQSGSHRRAHLGGGATRACPTPRRSSSRPARGPPARPWSTAPRSCRRVPRSSSSNRGASAVIISRSPWWRRRRRAEPASTSMNPPPRASSR